MLQYVFKRILNAIPILFLVNLLIFALFFMINSPEDVARIQLGNRHTTAEDIANWKHQHGYDLPLFYNSEASSYQKLTQTLFVQKSLPLFVFDFGFSDSGRNISEDVKQRMWPSLAIAAPTLILGLMVNISMALLLVFFRQTYLERLGTVLCLTLFSISGLFYVIVGQFVFSKVMHLVPISGYESGFGAIKFVILPILIGVIGGLGAGTRWYRTLFLEEMEKGYVTAARAKGLSEVYILFKHVLKNAMIPILTGVVVILPSLFLGSLILESFFGIPGLGSYMIDAIHQQDFAIVRSMVFLGAVLYIVGLLLTDISYVWVDPRVRLQSEGMD